MSLLSELEEKVLAKMADTGVSAAYAAEKLGVSVPKARKWLLSNGGIRTTHLDPVMYVIPSRERRNRADEIHKNPSVVP